MPTRGLWNIGGYNLPDWGISEFLGIGPKNAGLTEMGKWDLQQGAQDAKIARDYAQTISSGYPAGERVQLTARQFTGGNQLTSGQSASGQPASGQQTIPTPNYDALIEQINQTAEQGLTGLEPQRQAQEQIVGNTYGQGVSDLQAQQAQGEAALGATRRKAEENQVKTLGDLTENLRNMFSSGQNYLGARGAGDSSAANQYSYALTQMGNKNRGNVMSQTASIMNDINDRSNQLQMQVTQGIKQLDTEKQNALLGVSQWYASAQNQIRATRGQNVAQLGQAALDNAINAISDANAQYNVRYNSLLQWAENNATTINGLKQNLQQIGQFSPVMPQAGTLPGLTGGAVGSNGQYYSQSPAGTEKKDWWNQ